MSPPPEHDRDELFPLLERLCDGRLDAEAHERLQRRLKDDADAQRTYLDYVDLHLALARSIRPGRQQGQAASAPGRSAHRWARPAALATLGLAAALLAALLLPLVTRHLPSGQQEPVASGRSAAAAPRLAQSTGARFFGGDRPLRDGSPLEIGREYALTGGIVEVAFADGARAILKAPAVFTAADRARLILKLGQCSVHAPEGAEGFRVETPTADVVDRGTRFFVDVSETGGADVQVVEGRAEVYPERASGRRERPTRLAAGEARRYAIQREVDAREKAIAFDASRYAARLPDRIVSYAATERNGDGAERLQSLIVQRDGVLRTYRTEDLIGIDLVHFVAGRSMSNITTANDVIDPSAEAEAIPESATADHHPRAALLDRDDCLNTGVINPGGAREPLTEDPVFNDPEDPGRPGTPGLAVRFRRPVVNSSGPDVVFFDLQVIVHPERGDPFHVSPLRFAPGLKTHTVRAYDIDLSSPGARSLAGFRLYVFDATPRTLSELLQGRHNGGSPHRVRAKALVVGIDLSDLGYPPGATADGLFFQDVLDDSNFVDPVFIAGLPPIGSTGPVTTRVP